MHAGMTVIVHVSPIILIGLIARNKGGARYCAVRRTGDRMLWCRHVRGWQQRRHLDHMQSAAALIQSFVRMHAQRKR